MEPVWRLADSVERDEQFSLAASWSLVTLAEDWLWTDFLGSPTHVLGRHTDLSGKWEVDQRLSGRYELDQRLEGDV